MESPEPWVKVGRFSIRVLNAKNACCCLVIKLLAATEVEAPEKAEALLDEILSEVSADDQPVIAQSPWTEYV